MLYIRSPSSGRLIRVPGGGIGGSAPLTPRLYPIKGRLGTSEALGTGGPVMRASAQNTEEHVPGSVYTDQEALELVTRERDVSSSNNPGSWTKVLSGRNSTSPVLYRETRMLVKDDNVFAPLTTIEPKEEPVYEYAPVRDIQTDRVKPKADKGRTTRKVTIEEVPDEGDFIPSTLNTPTPHLDKGKGVDRSFVPNDNNGEGPLSAGMQSNSVPCYLHNLGIKEQELDVSAQRDALNTWKQYKASNAPVEPAADPDSIKECINCTTQSTQDYINNHRREVQALTGMKVKAEHRLKEAKKARLDTEGRLKIIEQQLAEFSAMRTDQVPTESASVGATREMCEGAGYAPERYVPKTWADDWLEERAPVSSFRAYHITRGGITNPPTSRYPMRKSVREGLKPSINHSSLPPTLAFVAQSSSLGQILNRKLKDLDEAMKALQEGDAIFKTTIKPQPPEKYSGKADLNAFQQFIKESVEYLINGQVAPKRYVSKLRCYLSDTAKEFYDNIVSSPEQWTIEMFFQELFNYCFPDGFLGEIRWKFNQWKQMNSLVKTYLAKMENYREDLGDEVGDRRFVQRVWSGLNDNISLRLYNYELHLDWSSYADLVHAAIHAEQAVNNSIHHDQMTTPKKTGIISSNATTNLKVAHQSKQGQAKPSASKDSPQNDQGPKQNKQRTDKASNQDKPKLLSSDEKKRHVEQNLCFVCHKPGHMSRNCPEQSQVKSNKDNKLPGSKTYLASINYAQIEELDCSDEEVTVMDTLHCGSMRYAPAGAGKVFILKDGLDLEGNLLPFRNNRSEENEEVDYMTCFRAAQETYHNNWIENHGVWDGAIWHALVAYELFTHDQGNRCPQAAIDYRPLCWNQDARVWGSLYKDRIQDVFFANINCSLIPGNILMPVARWSLNPGNSVLQLAIG
jgi:hypothetical protein